MEWQEAKAVPKACNMVILWMDKIHFAPPRKPWETKENAVENSGIISPEGFLGGAGFRPSTVPTSLWAFKISKPEKEE